MIFKTKSKSLKITVLMAGLTLILGLIAIPVLAQEKPQEKGSEVIDLGKITVMAPQPGVEITTEKTIIRMDEFQKPGEVRTLTDVLTEIGGIDVQRINPLMASPGDEVSIRGLNEGRMVIEIDGRRINHTGHRGRYIVDWSTLNMDDIDRIEIIRGGHSVLHPFAIGGVINIITKKGQRPDEPPAEASIKAGYGSFDTLNRSVSVNARAGNALGFHISGSKQETDGYLRNNFQDTENVNWHMTLYLPNEGTLTFGIKQSDVTYGFPVINDPDQPDYDSDYPKFYADADQLRHIPGAQPPGPPHPHWEKRTTYKDTILEVPVGPGTIKIHAFDTKGKRWISQYTMGAFVEGGAVEDTTKGVIAEYRDIALFDSHLLTVGAERQELGSPPANNIIYLVNSAYIQDVIQLGDRWKVTPGVRYYHVDMDTYYSQFGAGDPTPGKKEDDEGFYPSLKVDFQATPDTSLYAAVSRSYRLPCP